MDGETFVAKFLRLYQYRGLFNKIFNAMAVDYIQNDMITTNELIVEYTIKMYSNSLAFS